MILANFRPFIVILNLRAAQKLNGSLKYISLYQNKSKAVLYDVIMALFCVSGGKNSHFYLFLPIITIPREIKIPKLFKSFIETERNLFDFLKVNPKSYVAMQYLPVIQGLCITGFGLFC